MKQTTGCILKEVISNGWIIIWGGIVSGWFNFIFGSVYSLHIKMIRVPDLDLSDKGHFSRKKTNANLLYVISVYFNFRITFRQTE